MKKLSILTAIFASALAFSQTDINDARTNFSAGQTVTIKGVAANGSELGPIRYIQDATGGLPAYGTAINSVNIGDSIEISGTLVDFQGLLEISPATGLVSSGTGTVPTPLNVGITDLGENIEGRLVQINNLVFADAGTFATVHTNYSLSDGSNNVQFRVLSGTNLGGTAIPSGAVTVVGLLSEYNGTYQLLPRSTADIFAYSPPDKEIVVEIEGNNFFTGDEYLVGTSTSTNFSIENLGINDLTISGISFSGANSAEFSTTAVTGTVGPGATNNYTITFTPIGNGTKTASLIIDNDDADENPFIINLYAVGADGLATEPTSLPTNITFSNVEAYTLTTTYSPATDAENYIVLKKFGSAPVANPVDGVSYQKGDVLGDAIVQYVGAGTGFVPRGVRANQDYYFAVYPYNGTDIYANYNTSSPLFGNVTSGGANIANYYDGIEAEGNPNLISDLTSLINPHTYISYFLYKTTMMAEFELKDTTENRSFVECVYSGERYVYEGSFDWTATGYSREHTYAYSLMPTTDQDLPEYADQHNLYPTNLQQANSPRSNLPLNNITGDIVFNYLEGSVGEIVPDGPLCYEPRESHKGNAARAIFYMATAYEGIDNKDWSIASNQSQEVLKEWHFADAPDSYEIARNEYIFNLQGNRNPFVDSANYACFIDFSNMTYKANGCAPSSASINENDDLNSIVVFPNPSSGDVFVQVNGLEINAYTVYDAQGRIVMSYTGLNAAKIKLEDAILNAGSYIIEVTTTQGLAQKRFIKK